MQLSLVRLKTRAHNHLFFLHNQGSSLKQLDTTAFLDAATTIPLVDVRSPGEFEKGHTPGAHNIPLFSNEERAVVGTLYKQEGHDAAVNKGLEYFGPRMAQVARDAIALSSNGAILVHCWRGGMRSQNMAQLFAVSGLQAATLKGGYKEYRRAGLASFESPLQLKVLTGETGSGKTSILHALKEQGSQVIDLEGYAHHKGSAFGSLGQLPQPSTEHFHNLIYHDLRTMDINRPIWIEAESICIGSVHLPEPLFAQMQTSQSVTIALPIDVRIQRLTKEYGSFSLTQLTAALEKIKKRLGGAAYQECIELRDAGNIDAVARIILRYYDKAYSYGNAKRVNNSIVPLEEDNPVETAHTLRSLFE